MAQKVQGVGGDVTGPNDTEYGPVVSIRSEGLCDRDPTCQLNKRWWILTRCLVHHLLTGIAQSV
jgi:hypothetical protein